MVDDPAANPDGMFSRGDAVVKEADALLSYALGVSDKKPDMVQLELDPERVAAYLKRFLATNGLIIVSNSTVSCPSTWTDPGAVEGADAVGDDTEDVEVPKETARELGQRIAKIPARFDNVGLLNRDS